MVGPETCLEIFTSGPAEDLELRYINVRLSVHNDILKIVMATTFVDPKPNHLSRGQACFSCRRRKMVTFHILLARLVADSV
jgi:hypothetical protein